MNLTNSHPLRIYYYFLSQTNSTHESSPWVDAPTYCGSERLSNLTMPWPHDQANEEPSGDQAALHDSQPCFVGGTICPFFCGVSCSTRVGFSVSGGNKARMFFLKSNLWMYNMHFDFDWIWGKSGTVPNQDTVPSTRWLKWDKHMFFVCYGLELIYNWA